MQPPVSQEPGQETLTAGEPIGREAGWTPEGFHLAARATRDVVWDWDLRAGRVAWAGDTHSFFGVSPEELGRLPAGDYGTWASRVHPDDLEATEAAGRAALAGGSESWEQEYRFRGPDGSWSTILERAIIVRDEAGRALRVVGAMQNVTRRREAEETTSRLAAIVVSSSDAIIGKSLDGIITSWNAAAERIFGYLAAEIVGRSILTLIPEQLHDTERDLLQRIRQGERVEFNLAERIRKDGSRIHVALSVSPIRDATGVVIGASSIGRDVTERLRAREELARREQRYRALVTATSSVVSIGDAECRFVDPQPSWEAYSGQSFEEYRDLGWMNAIHPDDRDAFEGTLTLARGQRSFYEFEGRVWCRARSGYRHFVARGAPVIDEAGTVREWIGTLTDIEDRWQADQRLQHAERMESIGRLAGGVAHETNNQMTVVLGATRLLLKRTMAAEVREDLELVRRAAERTAAITRQLLAFSRQQLLQPQLVSLNVVVDTMQPIIRRALGETSRLVLHLDSRLHSVIADPGQLDQVLLNLTLNARDAMPGGGVLTIETTNVMVDEHVPASGPGEVIVPGPYARLTVGDTGMGMDRATLSHVFEPFFTTKDVGQGTGLGLPTVYGIVRQSGGFVVVSSEPGSGTSFEIYLPAATDRQTAEPVGSPVPPGGGAERVMVVEDDPAVRAMIARTLRSFGYSVIEAESGAAALELAGRPPGAPDLVVTDVVMPGMSGGELAATLRARWPAIRILFTSGYAGLEPGRPGPSDLGGDFLQKPLDPEALAERVRQILDTP